MAQVGSIISAKVETDTYEALREAAKAADRTISSEIRRILREYVERQKRSPR